MARRRGKYNFLRNMKDIPTSLYKYVPPDRPAAVLRKLLIRFSQVSVLNDALEFKPPLKGSRRPRPFRASAERKDQSEISQSRGGYRKDLSP